LLHGLLVIEHLLHILDLDLEVSSNAVYLRLMISAQGCLILFAGTTFDLLNEV
jgi:hypothetical protein